MLTFAVEGLCRGEIMLGAAGTPRIGGQGISEQPHSICSPRGVIRKR